MKRKWNNERVYNHLNNEVKLSSFFNSGNYDKHHWPVSYGCYLDLKEYNSFTLSERLVMCKIAMINHGNKCIDRRGLAYLTGLKDKLDTPEVWNCKSWRSLCNKVQYILLGHLEFIDEKSILIDIITKGIFEQFTHDAVNYKRDDIVLALRLYYISGYSRFDLYNSIESLEFPYNSDNIKDSILCTLKLLKTWKLVYLYDMMYETSRILRVKTEKISRNLIEL